MSDNFHIRPIEEKDIEQIVDLHLKIFPHKHQKQNLIDVYKWKFYENPYGNVLGRVATNKTGEILGVYAGIPLKLKLNSNELNALFITNIMVEENSRKLGIFKELYYNLHNKLKEENYIKVVLGFPNILSRGIGKKSLGFTTLLKMHRYVIPTRSFYFGINKCLENSLLKSILVNFKRFEERFNFTRPFLKIKLETCFEVNRLTGLTEEINSFLSQTKKESFNSFLKTKEILEWRYFKTPILNLSFYEIRKAKKIVGYFSLKSGYTCCVTDLFFLREQISVEEIFNLIAKQASHDKACKFIEIPIYDEMFENYLLKINSSVNDITAFCYFVIDNTMTQLQEDFLKVDSWFISGNEYTIG